MMRIKSRLLLALVLAGITHFSMAQQPGTLDASLNGKGLQTFSFDTGVYADQVTASYLQPDGKLLLALYGSKNGSQNYSSVMRLLSDGKADNTFGVGGKVTFIDPFHNGNIFRINAIALQTDERIILAGEQLDYYLTASPCLFSLKVNGSKDDLFNNGTGYYQDYEKYNYSYKTVQVHKATGTIIAAGGSLDNYSSNFLIQGFTSSGSIIDGYSTGKDGPGLSGLEFISGVEPQNNVATASVIKGDIMYISATVKDTESNFRFAIAAVDVAKVELATSFDVVGTKVFDLAPGESQPYNKSTALCFSPDSLYLWMGGYQEYVNMEARVQAGTADTNFVLAKVSVTGTIDEGFGENGFMTYSPGVGTNKLYAMVVDPNNGKITLAGSINDSHNWTAIRVFPNGDPDNSFGVSGTLIYNGENGNPNLNSGDFEYDGGIKGIHYLPATGKYLFLGFYRSNPEAELDVQVRRANNNGTADNTYGENARVKCSAMDANTQLQDVAVRSDGKLVVVGSVVDVEYGGYDYAAVSLLNTDGSKDLTFGGSNAENGSLYLNALTGWGKTRIMGMQLLPNDKILLAGDNGGDGFRDLFVMQLTKDGALDTDFNKEGTPGYALYMASEEEDYAQSLALQPDGKILVSGFFYDGEGYDLGIVRFNADGTNDNTFNENTGIYINDEYQNLPNESELGRTTDLKVKSDGKIVCAATKGYTNFMVFQLTKDGVLDAAHFNATGGTPGEYEWEYDYEQYANSLCFTSEGKIVVGGFSRTELNGNRMNYALIQLKEDGTLDTENFGVNGVRVIPNSYSDQRVVSLHALDSKIIAVGQSNKQVTVLRFTSKGLSDNTFYGESGQVGLTEGYTSTAVIASNKLYFVGKDRNEDGQAFYSGLIGKVSLGTGPIIKRTNLQLTDIAKTYGDAPFVLKPVSNSPASISYAITSNATKASVDATGLVTIKGATNEPVTIRLIQPAVTGFTADTAYASLMIARAIPKIIFNTQGDTLDQVISLQSFSNSPDIPYFEVVGGDNILEMVGNFNNQAYIYGEGCATVRVSYDETDNYLSGTATTSVCGYLELINPVAYNDQVDLVYPVTDPVNIEVLGNDEAYTGTIVASAVDLNPDNVGIDSIYISPSMGKFEVNSSGVVTFTPFQGFVGSGSIHYVIYDSKGSRSEVAKISVTVTTFEEIPALKATELFTPNNDGLNDAFVIGFVDLSKGNKLKVYDRNGAELFTKDNYNNDWNGDLPNGKKAENGIYYYLFTEGDDDNSRELKGVVELRR